MSRSNSTLFNEGMKKFQREMYKRFKEVGRKMMFDMLSNAIFRYQEMHSGNVLSGYGDTANYGFNEGSDIYLTGNTINAFGAALYVNGKVEKIIIAREFGVKPPTLKRYVQPGWYGYVDYGNGVRVTPKMPTREYSSKTARFIPADGQGGDKDAVEFLKNFRAHPKGIQVVICNAVPYAGYLLTVRKFDILISTIKDAKYFALDAIKTFGKL